MNKIEAINRIVDEANRGELVFSTNATASLKIQQALDAPDCGVDMAAKMVMNDPMLSARVVAIANSAAFNRGNDVTSVKAAISRLGFRTLRSVIASLVVRQLAGASKDPVIRAKTNQLWEHTAQVAALAQVIARRITKVDPDTAMFASIVHEVGGFYMLSRLEEYPCLLDIDEPRPIDELPAFTDTIIENSDSTADVVIGRIVLKILLLPAPVIDAVEALWYGRYAMPPETLGDTLVLANELASIYSPLDIRANDGSDQYLSEIDFMVGDGTLNSILEESEEEVRSLTAALLT